MFIAIPTFMAYLPPSIQMKVPPIHPAGQGNATFGAWVVATNEALSGLIERKPSQILDSGKTKIALLVTGEVRT
jgi:hypothetical protein